MEYIHAAMLLHSAKQQLSEVNIKKVLEAAGVKPEEGRVKALVASLEGVDIEAAVKEAAMPVVAVHTEALVPKKEEKKEEKKSEESAAAGLAGLFD